MADPFTLPQVAPKTTRAIRAAAAYVRERSHRQADARDILKGLVQHHGASISHPCYRTALRCGGIYSEAATCCDLATAKLLLSAFSEKANLYLLDAGGMDLFAALEAPHD